MGRVLQLNFQGLTCPTSFSFVFYPSYALLSYPLPSACICLLSSFCFPVGYHFQLRLEFHYSNIPQTLV